MDAFTDILPKVSTDLKKLKKLITRDLRVTLPNMYYVRIFDAMTTGLAVKEVKQVLDGQRCPLDGQNSLEHVIHILLDDTLCEVRGQRGHAL